MSSLRLLLGLCVVAIQSKQPTFEAYPASAWSGRPVAPALHSNPIGPSYRTVLRSQAALGPDFAGAYTVVRWGHGSGASDFAIVSAQNGGIFYDARFEGSWELQYRIDSRLLVMHRLAVSCAPGEVVVDSIDSYLWTGRTLRLIDRRITRHGCGQ